MDTTRLSRCQATCWSLSALTGVLIFAVLSLVSHLALRKWHESAVSRET